jgi:hypothetical protein
MHNLLYNIIPGAILMGVIVGGLLWCIVADMRAQNGRPPLRLRVPTSVRKERAPAVASARISLDT